MTAIPNGLFGVIARKNAGGGAPSTTSLLAYYDFYDATDSQASFTLTEVNTPTYLSGYGISTDATDDLWTQSTIDSSWGNTDADFSGVIRFRGYGSIANGNYVFAINANRNYLRWITGANGLTMEVADNVLLSTIVPSTGVWYVIYFEWNSSTGESKMIVNSTSVTPVSGVGSFTAGDLVLGGQNSTTGSDVEISYFALYNRNLDQSEYEWFTENPSIDRKRADM